MTTKIVFIGETQVLLHQLRTILGSSWEYEIVDTRRQGEIVAKMGASVGVVIFDYAPEGEDPGDEACLKALGERCATLCIPVLALCDPALPLGALLQFFDTGSIDCLPRTIAMGAMAGRIRDLLRSKTTIREADDARKQVLRDYERLKKTNFITLEYANMIENDLMDRIKSLSAERSSDGDSRATDALAAENAKLRLELEKASVVLATVISHDSAIEDQLDIELRETSELAIRDPLTKVYNRRKFNEELVNEYAEMGKRGTPLSLVMFDIDHFKRVNDSYGHDAGDEVLVRIAGLVESMLGSGDVFARWGGEEFMIIMPGTELDMAEAFAERLRERIGDERIDRVGRVTCSFGVIEIRSGDEPSSILKRVDHCVYEAKENGRDQVRSDRG